VSHILLAYMRAQVLTFLWDIQIAPGRCCQKRIHAPLSRPPLSSAKPARPSLIKGSPSPTKPNHLVEKEIVHEAQEEHLKPAPLPTGH